MINFNTANQTFRQLMGNGLSYKVPPFQRDYSWTEDEWDDLWQDILGLFADAPEPAHYMGYLVLQSRDRKLFDVIDGQQRLATLSAMILAGLSVFDSIPGSDKEKENNRKRSEQIRNSFIGYLDPVTLLPRSKLILNRHNDRFYQTYLVPLQNIPQRGLNASEHLLRKCFYWFQPRIKEKYAAGGESLARFMDTLVDKLFFTVITVDDELNAFKVFETLNARGVRLSATDLLKNYLFSIVDATGPHETEIAALEDAWEKIIGTLGSESLPDFFRVFWNSRNPIVRKAELFKTIKGRIKVKGEVFALLRNLESSAGIYAALQNPSDPFWETDMIAQIKALRMFGVRQPFSLLLAIHDRFFEIDPALFNRCLRALTIISFRYNVICNYQTNEQERVYNIAAQAVSEGKLSTYQEIMSILKPVYTDDKTYYENFIQKVFQTTSSRNKKVVRYILFEIEKHVSSQDFDSESTMYTLEHILPENPGTEWADYDETRDAGNIYRIGNMTLLKAGENKDLGNKGFAGKKETYQKSDFTITKEIDKYDSWNPDKIQARQTWLAKQAKSIWRLDF